MRKGRKAIIAELKETKSQLRTASEKNAWLYSDNCTLQARYAEEMSKSDNFRRRLERLEDETEYFKGADRGTVVATARVSPETIEMTARGNRYQTPEDVRREMCSLIAEKLFSAGLVKCTTEPEHSGFYGFRVTARVDVIPWDLISHKSRVVVMDDGRAMFDPEKRQTIVLEGGGK